MDALCSTTLKQTDLLFVVFSFSRDYKLDKLKNSTSSFLHGTRAELCVRGFLGGMAPKNFPRPWVGSNHQPFG